MSRSVATIPNEFPIKAKKLSAFCVMIFIKDYNLNLKSLT